MSPCSTFLRPVNRLRKASIRAKSPCGRSLKVAFNGGPSNGLPVLSQATSDKLTDKVRGFCLQGLAGLVLIFLFLLLIGILFFGCFLLFGLEPPKICRAVVGSQAGRKKQLHPKKERNQTWLLAQAFRLCNPALRSKQRYIACPFKPNSTSW